MTLILATVVESAAEFCRVRVLGESDRRTVGFTDPFRPRAGSVGPGCLVAVQLTTGPPLIAWRWFPATVLATDADHVRLAEPFHGIVDAAPVDPAPAIGAIVFATTGLSDGWRIDADVDEPERAAAALPEIEELYRRNRWT